MNQILAVLIGIGVLIFVLVGIFCVLLIKGTNIGRRVEDDEEQEKWIGKYCNRDSVYNKR